MKWRGRGELRPLHDMSDAFRAQVETTEAGHLTFEERLRKAHPKAPILVGSTFELLKCGFLEEFHNGPGLVNHDVVTARHGTHNPGWVIS